VGGDVVAMDVGRLLGVRCGCAQAGGGGSTETPKIEMGTGGCGRGSVDQSLHRPLRKLAPLLDNDL
jgi:hypothetical protein